MAFEIVEILGGSESYAFNSAQRDRVFRVRPSFTEFSQVADEYPWPVGGEEHPRIPGIYAQSVSIQRFPTSGYVDVVWSYAPFQYSDQGPAFDAVNNALNPGGNWSVEMEASPGTAEVLTVKAEKIRSAQVGDAVPTFSWVPATSRVEVARQSITLIAARTYPRVSTASVPDAVVAFQPTAAKVDELHLIGGQWLRFAGASVRQETEQDTQDPRWSARYRWVFDPGVASPSDGVTVYNDENGTPNAVGVDGPDGFLYPHLPNVLLPADPNRYAVPPYSQVTIRPADPASGIERPIFVSRLLQRPNAMGYTSGLFIVNGAGS